MVAEIQDGEGDAYRLIKIQGQLESERHRSEEWWRETAYYCLPGANSFSRTMSYDDVTELFDSTAPLALERFAAAMEQMLTPRTMIWHSLKAPTRAGPAGKSHEVKRFYQDVREVLFDYRYGGKSNFASSANEAYNSIGAFGNGVLYIEGDATEVIKYAKVPMSESYYAYDAWGRLVRFHRKYMLALHAVLKEFPDADLPEDIRERAKKNPLDKIEILHTVEQNDAIDTSRADHRGMEWSSRHVMMDKRITLRRGGYRRLPYIVGRYSVGDGETYARSVALMALADIRMLNRMGRTSIAYANRAAEATLLATDMDLPAPPLLEPNAINPGYLSADGKPLLVPLQQGADFNITLELQNQKREAINAAFLVTLFQILVDQPTMTATEVLQRAQEKGALMAPTMGRLQGEFLANAIERELDIHAAAGTLPEPPPEIEAIGFAYEVEYQSPLARMQRAEEGAGILRSLDGMRPLAELGKVDWLDNVNTDETLRRLWEINGAPADLLIDPDDVEGVRSDRADAAQAENAAAGMPDAASAAKDFASAADTAGLI